MKTKIVYVVVSDDSDFYLEQTLLSVYSARLYMPEAEIVLIVDDLTDKTIQGKRAKILEYISLKVVVEIEKKYTNQQRSRILKTTMREHVNGDFLFIDSDTIITSSLEEADEFNFDIAAVKDLHAPNIALNPKFDHLKKLITTSGMTIEDNSEYFNSGVIFAKDNELTRSFFKTWNNLWHESVLRGINKDQPSFAKAHVSCGNLIKELPGYWNCQVRYGVRFLHKSKVIHYFASGFLYYKKNDIHEFMNKDIFMELKQNGEISDKMFQMITNPLDYFNSEYVEIVCDKNLIQSDFAKLFRVIVHNNGILFRFSNFISRIILKIYH